MTEDTAEQEQEDTEQEDTPYVDAYGLSDIKFIECRNESGVVIRREVTDAHRYKALASTHSETLKCFDEGLRQMSPGLRRYGRTLADIVLKFQSERAVIREEMTRIAVKNLTAVVSGKLNTRRVLNLAIAIADKRERDGVSDEAPSADEGPLGLLEE